MRRVAVRFGDAECRRVRNYRNRFFVLVSTHPTHLHTRNPLAVSAYFLLPLLCVFVQGTLTVVGESETMVRASMDAECNVSMDAHAPLGMPGLAGKLTVHQGKNDLIQGTALYYGERGLQQ